MERGIISHGTLNLISLHLAKWPYYTVSDGSQIGSRQITDYAYINEKQNESEDTPVFPQLDALHVLDTSAHFDAGWSGRNKF